MSLKDALLKAGFKGTKSENEREYKPKKDLKKSEVHQQDRNFCEICKNIQPDVERFKHRNRLIDAQWMCVVCADKNEIHDDFRVTQQSEFAKKKRYRRNYGPTHNLNKEQRFSKTKNSSGNNRHNSNRSNRSGNSNGNRSYNKKKY